MSRHHIQPLEVAVEPLRRRLAPHPALVFEAMPGDGWIAGRVSAPSATDRLNFVPHHVFGELAPDPEPAPIRVPKTGWSVRESPRRCAEAALAEVAAPAPAATRSARFRRWLDRR